MMTPELEAAIEAGVADGSIFSDSHRPDSETWPVEFFTLSPALRETTKVMWRCSCGEMWSGVDIERDVHVHAAFEGGTHRVAGPIFANDDTEADVRAAWAKEDHDD
jgi:hypothetical protein